LFSKLTKTTVKTLRYYDEIGLLKPARIDEGSGYRYYTTDQLQRLHEIVALRQIGLGLEEIREVLTGGDAREIIAHHRGQLEEQLKAVQDQLSRLDHFNKNLGKGEWTMYNAVIKEIPEQIIYRKELVAPDYDSYFELIPAIGEEVMQANPDLTCAEPEYCFIEYLDGEYREKDMRIAHCEAVTDFGVETDSITFETLPSTTVVAVLHKGAYAGLREAYAYLFRWIEGNGYEMAGNPRESYIDGIWNKESEEEWLTELQVPIKKSR
jgi:DNA-binding transcriptional MerR regulator